MRLRSPHSCGSVLVGLLWCLTLLAVIVIGVLHSSRLDLKVTKNLGDAVQARYLALAGIEKAKALLYRDYGDRKRTRRNHSAELANNPQEFKDIGLGRGAFRVFYPTPASATPGQWNYGVRDEEALLNVNEATEEELKNLPGMTPDLIAALIDFRDEDQTPRSGGAEAEYYLSLTPPYLPKNAPLETLRELLGVRGFTEDLLFGADRNADGIIEDSDQDRDSDSPEEAARPSQGLGLAHYFTVHSSVQNVNAAGDSRIDVQSADEATLTTVSGISSDIAQALVAYRNQNRLGSLDDLLDVTRVNPQSQRSSSPNAGNPPPGQPSGPGRNPAPAPAPRAPTGSGEKLISQDLLLQIADDITVHSESEQHGLININTAEATVLQCLPGVERELANAIVDYRQSAGPFQNVAWLLRVPGMTRQVFKQLAPKVTARSETFRILGEGTIQSSGVHQRLEVVVRLRSGNFETLSYREDL